MRVLLTWLLVLVSNLCAVTSIYIPPPVFETIPRPANMTSEKLIFMAEANVTVKCYLPMETIPEDIKLEMRIIHYDDNPVYPDEQTHTIDHSDPLQLKIQYNTVKFTPWIEILCRALNLTTLQIKNSSSIVIEQKYKTMNMVVFPVHLEPEAGEKVRLHCLADGNPKPQYQWYNQTENGTDIKLINGSKSLLEFMSPTKWSTTGLYTCEAKNEYNAQAVKSNAITVTSFFIPPPQILSTPLPTNDSTEDNLVYLEAQLVTVTCSLPITVPMPTFMKLDMRYRQFPDYPEAKKTLEDQKDNITLHIEYEPKEFAYIIEVSCVAYNMKKFSKESTIIQIEQLYRTRNVIIEGMQDNIVEPGTQLQLTCVADGNPKPSLYQWYTTTGSGLAELAGANQSSVVLSIPREMSTNEYICEAKNPYNNDFVRSHSVKVSGRNAAVAHSSSWLVLVLSVLIGLARTASSM